MVTGHLMSVVNARQGFLLAFDCQFGPITDGKVTPRVLSWMIFEKRYISYRIVLPIDLPIVLPIVLPIELPIELAWLGGTGVGFVIQKRHFFQKKCCREGAYLRGFVIKNKYFSQKKLPRRCQSKRCCLS